jgi:hypothetical protein
MYKIFAKTSGPINQAILDGYRHEFGSLPHVEENAEFQGVAGGLARSRAASRRRASWRRAAPNFDARLRGRT